MGLSKKASKLVVCNIILKMSITSSNSQTTAKRRQVIDFSAVWCFFSPSKNHLLMSNFNENFVCDS